MITHTNYDVSNYYKFLKIIIKALEREGKEIFLLNHEGNEDLYICKEINKKFNNKYTIVSNLNAKQIKGVIGASFFVISSRYHGLVSALNQGIPCLATSWNHKYEMLLEEYNQKDKILNLNKPEEIYPKIKHIIDSHNHIKKILENCKERNIIANQYMWNNIWKILKV